MKFLRVNMDDLSINTEAVSKEYYGLGGRGLTSIMINQDVPASCDALGAENKLIFAPGYLSGTTLVNSSRLSIGAKSPLTGGIKESNVGGTVAADIASLGITAVIIEGKIKDDKFYILRIDQNGQAELLDAAAYTGLNTYDLVKKLKADFGDKNSVTCIGTAGEMKLKTASIQTSDFDGRPCRAAGRGGLGAVMGSKGIKALVVSRGGKSADEPVDNNTFNKAAKAYAKAVKADEFSGEILPELGTAVLVDPINAAGGLPSYNATKGQFENADKINGDALASRIKKRGGKTTHKGCAQCIINCSNEYVDEKGRYVTSSLEYETIWAMGPMLGNDDLDVIATLDFLCDNIGIDTMSTGASLAIAMDAGYKEFGDGAAAIEMVRGIGAGTEFGKILGNGPAAVGRHFNHKRVPVVKGQSIAAYDPRAIQGMAVTYATSPMGGDHTAGWVVDQNLADFGGTLDPLSDKGQVDASRDAQLHMAAVDTVGICDFAQSGLAAEGGMENVFSMVSSKSGKAFGEKEWAALGSRILKAELDFNKKAGFTNKDDRLPEMFYKEPLPPHNTVVVVSDEQMDSTFDFEE